MRQAHRAGSRVTIPGAACCDGMVRGGAVVEAESEGDDRRRGLEDELAERCCPGLGEWDAEFVKLSAKPDGHEGLPDAAGRPAG